MTVKKRKSRAKPKSQHKKDGRRTKMTEITVKKLEEAFALGCTDVEACLYADISKPTLYAYEKKNPKFNDRKAALKETPVLLARKSVVEAIPDDPDLAMKYLERKRKDEFSVKQIVDTKVTLDLDDATREELEAELAMLKRDD